MKKNNIIAISAAAAVAAIGGAAYVIGKLSKKKKSEKYSDAPIISGKKTAADDNDHVTVYAKSEFWTIKMPKDCPAHGMVHIYGEARVPRDIVKEINNILNASEMGLEDSIAKAKWLAGLGFDSAVSLYNAMGSNNPQYWSFDRRYTMPEDIEQLESDVARLMSGEKPKEIFETAALVTSISKRFDEVYRKDYRQLSICFRALVMTEGDDQDCPLSKFVGEQFDKSTSYYDTITIGELPVAVDQFTTMKNIVDSVDRKRMSQIDVFFDWSRNDRTGYENLRLPVSLDALVEVVDAMTLYALNPNEETDAALTAVVEKYYIEDEYCVDDEGYLTDD